MTSLSAPYSGAQKGYDTASCVSVFPTPVNKVSPGAVT